MRNRWISIVLCLLAALSLQAKVTFVAKITSDSPAGCGSVGLAYVVSGSAAPDRSTYTTGSSSVSVSIANDAVKYDGYFLAIPNPGYRLVGWYQEDGHSSLITTDNPLIYTQQNYKNRTYTRTRYALFEAVPMATVTFETTTHGSYTCHMTDSTEDLVGKTVTDVETSFELTATPDPGYKIMGWYLESNGVRNYFSNASSLVHQKFTSGTVGVLFTEMDNPVWLVRDTTLHNDYYFLDLNIALDTAVAVRDRGAWNERTTAELVSSGVLPVGDYTIPERVFLYIPHNDYHLALSEKPDGSINEEKWRWSTYSVTAYRTLTMSEGCNFIVNGYISIGGTQAMVTSGYPSGYPFGPCGRLDMSQGGSITLNDGARLYCWGFLTGQSVTDGNNTKTVGTIHALSGSRLYEYFAVADWRGGSATSTIVGNRFDWRVFPFTNYFIQNCEVPITFEYGSAEYCSTAVQAGSMSLGISTLFCLIGSTDAMFKLVDNNSIVRTWYDPTTDHMVYELNGSADISLLKVNFYVDVNSQDYNLPIPSSMHVKLRNCNIAVTNPITIQAGAVFEVMAGSNLTIDTCIYVFDHDDWGKFVLNYYYRSLNRTMTPHYDRGEGDVNNLEDAKIVVDGTVTVGKHGHLYCTNAGANICGNGGGQLAVSAKVPDSTAIVQLLSYETPAYVPVYAAKLCSENGTYLPTEDKTHYYNLAGRWFRYANKDPKPDHTWDYTYIRTDASGHFLKTDSSHFVMDTTAAVLWYDANAVSHWTDVYRPTAGECYSSNDSTWQGKDGNVYYYNGTEWLRLVPVVGTEQYGGSNNHLYTCNNGQWTQGEGVDGDCLYTIDGTKKALVGNQFVPIAQNAPYDYAWHAVSDASDYYINFPGCDWRHAVRVPGKTLAYYVFPTAADYEQRSDSATYIYIADSADWVQVEYEDPFYYTMTDENLRFYWDYFPDSVGSDGWGKWLPAQPIVRVDYVDYGYKAGYREFYNLPDAVLFASTKSVSSITLMRDLACSRDMRYSPNESGSTCTLDLNGHTVTCDAVKALTIDFTYCTFRIQDSSTDKSGVFSLLTSNSKACYALYVSTGNLILDSVTVTAWNTAGTAYAIYTNTAQSTSMPFGYLSAKSKSSFSAPVAGPNQTTLLYDGYLTSNTYVYKYLPQCLTAKKINPAVVHNGISFNYKIDIKTVTFKVLTDNASQGSVSATPL